MKNAMWYFKLADTLVNGPFTSAELQQHLETGRISADTPVRLGEHGLGWKTAEFFGLVLPPGQTVEQTLINALDTQIVVDVPGYVTLYLTEAGLCDSQHRVTPKGQILGIALCELADQCRLLGLSHEIWELPRRKRPELAVMADLQQRGWSVAYCEGGALSLLLYCLCFDRLYAIYKRLAIAQRSRDPENRVHFSMYCIRFGREDEVLKSFGHHEVDLSSQLVADIENATESALLRAFDILLRWQRQPPGHSPPIPPGRWRWRNWVGVDRDFILVLFRALGASRLATIAKQIITEPDSLAAAGWPDLMCVRDTSVELVEVKTSDRLIESQIIAIPRIRAALQLPINVVQVKWIGR